MPSYTIQAVSDKTEQFETDHGHMVKYYVKFQGADDAIQINKKPSSDPPAVGQVLDGDIETTKWGKKFKAAFKQFSTPGGSGSASSSDPNIQASIHAQFAIREAREWVQYNGGKDEAVIEEVANTFFAMIDRVKAGKTAGDKQDDLFPPEPGDLNQNGGFSKQTDAFDPFDS